MKRQRQPSGKHEFLDPAERAELVARLETQPKPKASRKVPTDPEAARKLADFQLARQAAKQTSISPEDQRRGYIFNIGLELPDQETLDVLDNEHRRRKPLTVERASAAIKRRFKAPRTPARYRSRPEPHDAETLLAFERRHGEQQRYLATGWTPYRGKGKTRGRGISLKSFAEKARPKRGQKCYTDADRAKFADACRAARELLDVFAVQHDKADIARREAHEQQAWREMFAMLRRRKRRSK